MNNEAKVTILMLVWNALENVKLTLESLYNSDEFFKLLIWDNGSNEETKNYLREFEKSHDNIKVFYSDNNIGTWNARYKLAQEADTEFVFTADSDLFFPTKWLTPLLNTFRSQEKVGQVGPLKLSRSIQHPYIESNIKSVWHEIENKISDPKLQLQNLTNMKSFDEFVDDLLKSNSTLRPDLDVPTRSISTCSMLTRRELFLDKAINDPAYSAINWGMEDVDYSWSLANLGYKVLKCTDTYIHHFEHSSLQDNNTQMENSNYIKVLEYFLNKWEEALVSWCEKHTKEEIAFDEFTLLVKKFNKINIPNKLKQYYL